MQRGSAGALAPADRQAGHVYIRHRSGLSASALCPVRGIVWCWLARLAFEMARWRVRANAWLVLPAQWRVKRLSTEP